MERYVTSSRLGLQYNFKKIINKTLSINMQNIGMENITMQENEIPRIFNSLKDAKQWIHSYSNKIFRGIKVKYSKFRLYHVVCKDNACEFVFKISLNKQKTYTLKNWAFHTCQTPSSSIRSFYTSSVIKTVYKDVREFKVNNAKNQLLSLESINSTYHQAYRALKILKSNDEQLENKSYSLIKPWLQWHVEDNEGSAMDYREKIDINE